MSAVAFTPLKRITAPLGTVMHALKSSEPQFQGFGEAYFTSVHYGATKGWKRHKEMVLNLIVPFGRVRFVFYNGGDQHDRSNFETYILSSSDDGSYGRLTVAPGLWFAFQGLAPEINLVLNIASILHDPEEAENVPLSAIQCDWLISLDDSK